MASTSALWDPTVAGLDAYPMSAVEAFLGMFLLLLVPVMEGLSKVIYKLESKEVTYKVTRTPEQSFAKVQESFQVMCEFASSSGRPMYVSGCPYPLTIK